MAVTLILVIAIVCLIGILLPQITAEFSATPDGYAWWVENVAYANLGNSAYTFAALGFFDIFRSAWFIGAMALLMLNILACSIPRIKSIRAESTKSSVKREDAFYQNGAFTYEFETPLTQKQYNETVIRVLEENHYAVVREETADSTFFTGEKRKFSRWATLFVHLSLILLLLGVIVGSLSGFRDDAFIVTEGETKEIGHGTGLSISLLSFSDSYWEEGTPKDYKSEISIYQDQKKVKSGTVRVNHPLSYQGVNIHQGFFGQAVGLELADADGNILLQDQVALTGYETNDDLTRPEGTVTLSENGYTIVLLGSAINGTDPYIGQDQIGIEFYDADMNFIGWLILNEKKPQQIGDISIQYSNLQYSGFLVSKDPGAPLIGIAAALFLLGLGMIFYFPDRRIWVKTQTDATNHTRVAVKLDARKDFGLEREAHTLIKLLGYGETDGKQA